MTNKCSICIITVRRRTNVHKGGVSGMYAEGMLTREEFRQARREQVKKELRDRRKRILIYGLTLILMFGMGVGFGTLLAKAEETEDEPVYKYYTSIEIQKGDTLWDLADAYMDHDYYETRADYINEVMKINHLVTGHLFAGKKLIIPYYSTKEK